MTRPALPDCLRLSTLAALLLSGSHASAHVPPPQFPVERPRLEVTSWVGVGGGALGEGKAARGVFDLRLGYDVTLPLGREGDLRVGPFLEVGSATFASLGVVGGLELFLGATPRPLRMFYYDGEGTFLFRFGGGWSWWSDLPTATSTPLASVTVAYGYRCPFSLREPTQEWAEEPGQRRPARYMVGVRFWVNGQAGLASRVWQLTGGIELEPVGSFRYVLGLY